MKILITEEQYNNVIRASEAYDDLDSIETLVKGKRGVAFISLDGVPKKIINQINSLISENSLKITFVKQNPNNSYIVYRQGFEKEAQELYSIAQKYGGFLSVIATEEDSRRIGQLLGYHPDDIETYILHNREIQKKLKSKK